jgi:hypothetical protein
MPEPVTPVLELFLAWIHSLASFLFKSSFSRDKNEIQYGIR